MGWELAPRVETVNFLFGNLGLASGMARLWDPPVSESWGRAIMLHAHARYPPERGKRCPNLLVRPPAFALHSITSPGRRAAVFAAHGPTLASRVEHARRDLPHITATMLAELQADQRARRVWSRTHAHAHALS